LTSFGFEATKETIFHIISQYDEDEAGVMDF